MSFYFAYELTNDLDEVATMAAGCRDWVAAKRRQEPSLGPPVVSVHERDGRRFVKATISEAGAADA